jgi:rSAM/selenodomain-associated transferase 1
MNALIVFAKFPVPGQVKKKIGTVIGMENSAKLCEAFINDLIAEHSERDYDIYLSFIGHEHKEQYRTKFPHAILYVQKGVNMSERVQCSFEDLLDDYEKLALIGSDVPDLSTETVIKAFNALDSYDVVLGPVDDGGYYIVAMKEPHDVFKGMPWGKDTLLEAQIKVLKERKLTFVLLDKLNDVDTIEELKAFKKIVKREEAPRTYDVIQSLDV